MYSLRRSPSIRELNDKAQVNNDQVTATKPIVLRDSKTRKQKEMLPIGQAREANLQRTTPHQLNLQSSRQMNIEGSAYMSHLLGINPQQTSCQVHDQFGFSSASFGKSSFQPQNQATYSGIVPREGQTTAYLYYPLLSSFSPNASSSSSGSASKQGTPMAHHNTSEQLRKLAEQNNFGGSDPRAASHRLNHHISSFYPVTPLPRTNHSSLAPLQPARNQQPPLPSYLSSEITNGHSSNAGRSASVLGKRPAESFFQPPAPPVDAGDDMAAVEHGPQCNLQTVDLLSLVESVGTPEFLANSERVLGSAGGSLYEPRRAAAAAAAAPAHVPAGVSSDAVPPPEPSLLLGLGDGNGDGRGKGKEVWSYWNSSAMARTMERKRGTETTAATQANLASPVKTLGLDGQGCSRDAAMQRRPWN